MRVLLDGPKPIEPVDRWVGQLRLAQLRRVLLQSGELSEPPQSFYHAEPREQLEFKFLAHDGPPDLP